MRRKFLVLAAVALCGAVAPAAVEETTSAAASFKMYTTGGGTYALTSEEDFSTWLVSWREGDTVTATPATGAASTLVADAPSAGSRELPRAGGLWMLESALSGTAKIGVPWSVFSDGGELAGSVPASGRLDTCQTGPDRRTDKRSAPPVAYSGDNWARDVSKASVVTFTPPEGSELSETVWNRNGSGADSFTFGAAGLWTVTLQFEDGTERTAKIDIVSPGLIISIE